jgi:hypothetical protein
VSDIPNDSFPVFDLEPRSALVDWFWRIPLLLRWDGVLPLLSPITVLSLSLLQFPRAVLGLLGTLVPVCVALARAALAQREIVRVCGDRGTLDRHFALAIAIILLLVLDVVTTILVMMNAGMREWSLAALLYVGYVMFIAYALRLPRAVDPTAAESGPRSAAK